MYEQGDIVIYGAQGICRIEAVGPLNLRIGAPGAQYYTLRSYYHPELVIYAPVNLFSTTSVVPSSASSAPGLSGRKTPSASRRPARRRPSAP